MEFEPNGWSKIAYLSNREDRASRIISLAIASGCATSDPFLAVVGC